jgi:hypothetical protein
MIGVGRRGRDLYCFKCVSEAAIAIMRVFAIPWSIVFDTQ